MKVMKIHGMTKTCKMLKANLNKRWHLRTQSQLLKSMIHHPDSLCVLVYMYDLH